MNIYEATIKTLASSEKDTINNLGKIFIKNYNYCKYISYENMLSVVNYIKEYLPDLFTEEDEKYYKIFGQIYFKVEMKRWSNSSIYIDNKIYNPDNFTTVNCRNTECPYACDDCCTFCENVPIFFIDVFYDFCLSNEILKNFSRAERENKIENEKITQKSNDLRIIAENLVNNFDEYKEIIDNLYNIGLEDERIYNIFYEILKNIK